MKIDYNPMVIHREVVPFFSKQYAVWCIEYNDRKYIRYWDRENSLVIKQIDLPNTDWESIIVSIPEIIYMELL